MTTRDPQPPEEIRTDRLVLSCSRPGDGPALHAAIAESMTELFPWVPFSKKLETVEGHERLSVQAQEKFSAGEFYVWRIRLAGEEAILGAVDLHAIDRSVPSCELGYWIRSSHAGRGLAKEAAAAVVRIAIETLGMIRIEARCDERNERSWRFAERLGFVHEGTLRRDHRDAGGELGDTRIYAWVRDEA